MSPTGLEAGLQLVIAAYVISMGFGMVVGQKRGALAVHRFWMKAVVGISRWLLRTVGDLCHWAGSKPKKKP